MNEKPQKNEQDIFAYGFDKNLNRKIQAPESPTVYDSVNDRTTQNFLSANLLSFSVPGLVVVEI